MSVVTPEHHGAVSIIRINRPKKINAISSALAVERQLAFQAFGADAGQRVAALSSMGDRAFIAGAGVTDLQELWRCIPGAGFQTDKPTIAATTAWVVGGGIVVVMMCDPMVFTESTMFYDPEAKLGLTGGMISSLLTRMPHKLAMEMMLLCSEVPVHRAYEVGFVNRVVPNGQHDAEALKMAAAMLDSAPLVIGALKRLVADVPPVGRPGGMHGRGQPDAGPRLRQRGHAGRHPRPRRTPQATVQGALSPPRQPGLSREADQRTAPRRAIMPRAEPRHPHA